MDIDCNDDGTYLDPSNFWTFYIDGLESCVPSVSLEEDASEELDPDIEQTRVEVIPSPVLNSEHYLHLASEYQYYQLLSLVCQLKSMVTGSYTCSASEVSEKARMLRLHPE